MSVKNGNFTAAQMLLPMSILALVVFIGTAFQTVEAFHDRSVLHQAKTQQDKPLEDAQKVRAQLDALAVGTLKLAQEGDKNAQAIIDRLKALGITVAQPKASSTMPSSPGASALPSTPATATMPAKP